MPGSQFDAVMAEITAERAKAPMIELARVPSPLTSLLEAEPKLREFIDAAVEPRLHEMGFSDIRRDGMGNLVAAHGRAVSSRSVMLRSSCAASRGNVLMLGPCRVVAPRRRRSSICSSARRSAVTPTT